MADSWDVAETRAANHKSGGTFLKIEDKEKVVLAFIGEVVIRDIWYNKVTSKYEDWTAEHEKAGKKPTPHYLANVYVPKEDAVMVIEMSNATFKEVIKVKKKYGLDKKLFEVEREGTAKDTSYTILPDDDLSDKIRAKIETHKLHDLKNLRDDEGDASTDMSSHDKKANGATPATNAKGGSDEAPTITNEQFVFLRDRLKVLEKAKIDAFQTKFKISQIKKVLASDYAAAAAYVDELEGKKPGAATQEEVDPFS
jgi:hypothetical protein